MFRLLLKGGIIFKRNEIRFASSKMAKKSDLSKKLCVGAVEGDVVGEIDVDADDGVV